MCIIIIKQKTQKISKETLRNSARINPHGLGIIWLDNFKVEHMKSKEWLKLHTSRPFIAHFRFATIGVVNRANIHPFQCGANKNEWLMMNGTIHGLGYKDEATARASVSKIRNSSRSHAHKTQAAIAMEQRAKAGGKSKEAAIFRKFIEQQKKNTKAKNK